MHSRGSQPLLFTSFPETCVRIHHPNSSTNFLPSFDAPWLSNPCSFTTKHHDFRTPTLVGDTIIDHLHTDQGGIAPPQCIAERTQSRIANLVPPKSTILIFCSRARQGSRSRIRDGTIAEPQLTYLDIVDQSFQEALYPALQINAGDPVIVIVQHSVI